MDEDFEILLENLVREVRKRDTTAAVLISTSFVLFGVLVLVLLDVINVGEVFKGMLAVTILAATWAMMSAGVYMLLSTPLPELPSRIVADSSGALGLMELNYGGKVYIPRESYRKLPPTAGLRLNFEIIEVPRGAAMKYADYGVELSEAIAAAKMLRAKVVTGSMKGKVDGVEIIAPEDVI